MRYLELLFYKQFYARQSLLSSSDIGDLLYLSQATERRLLAAVMFTDIVGYTALTQSDETQTLEVLQRHNKLLRSFFPKFHGREVKTIGDSFLIEFDSALDATLCAVEIQEFLHDYNISANDSWKIKLRIGIHLGDVVKRNDDIFGDAVNIASRLQPLAEPEGVCISEQVYYQVRNKMSQVLQKMELHDLKGVRFPVEAYKVVMPWEHVSSPLPGAETKNRIAILPFANMSPDPNDEYFADGMTEELIDRLAQIKGIEVIARTSVMSYKKRDKKASEIARELVVGSLVEGSVRKAGNRVRVTAQLINGVTEGHLWSSHYDGNLDDIFAVQGEIAEKVVEELKIRLLQSEKESIDKKPTENMEAYDNFLRGRELLRERPTDSSLRQALKLFERAVELDPAFAKAHVGVAQCNLDLGNFGYGPADATFSAAKASLENALYIDPDLADAHASLAMLHYVEDDLIGTEAEARRALELNPNVPEAYQVLFEVAGIKDDPEEMVKHIEAAYRLDPLRKWYIRLVGEAYSMTGRTQDALDHWRRTEYLAPAETYQGMTHYYLYKGDIANAREFHAKFEKLHPTDPWVIYTEGVIDAMAGDREKAILAIRKMEERKLGSVSYNYIAYVYHALGDMDNYFECMNKALDEHAIILLFVIHSPLLAKAREDPRYGQLVEKFLR